MFAIFEGNDPKYDDYIFSGIMEHSSKRLFYAIKNEGRFITQSNVKDYPIMTSGKTTLNVGTRIQIDYDGKAQNRKWYQFMKDTLADKLQDFKLEWLGASCAYYMDVASGASDIALECTRKGNLEMAIAYGLINESGGIMMTLDGKDIGNKKYFRFGQKPGEYIPVITAATPALADRLIHHLNRK